MVASVLRAGLRLGLAAASVLTVGIAVTVANSNASDAVLEPMLLPSRPPAAVDAVYPQRLEQLKQSLARGAASDWDGVYQWGTGYEGATLHYVQGIGYAYESSTCVTHYRSIGDLIVDGGRFEVHKQSSSEFTAVAEQPQLIPVRWGGRRYLVSPDRVGIFLDEIEDGMEPRCGRMGSAFLREGDEHIAVAGPPEFPAQWQGLLRETPLELRVASVDLDVLYNAKQRSRTMRHTLTLDGGTDRGVVTGMVLSPVRVGEFHGRVTVTAVREHDATALHESVVYAQTVDESKPALPDPDGSRPQRSEVVGPYAGGVLKSAALPKNIGELHCLADLTRR